MNKIKVKPGDLVKLHPNETRLIGLEDQQRLGLVMEVLSSTQPRTISVLWHGCSETDDEYEDGLVLMSKA